MTIGRTKSYVAVRGAATYFPIGVPPPPQHKFGEHIRRQMLCKTFATIAFDDEKVAGAHQELGKFRVCNADVFDVIIYWVVYILTLGILLKTKM